MEELIKRAKNKDQEAFTELILGIEKELYVIAKIRIKQQDDMYDVIQETMLKAYSNLHKLRENKYFKTWMIRILINECNKKYKKRKYQEVTYESQIIEEELFYEDTHEKIHFEALITPLEEKEKIIITLYYYLKYTTKEISQILHIKESTIRSKIARAKTKMKKYYEGGMNHA